MRRYLNAVWSVAAVFALTMFAKRYAEMDGSPAYLAAVMFSTWRGGLGAGLLATALSAAVGVFFFLPPEYSFKVDGEGVLELGKWEHPIGECGARIRRSESSASGSLWRCSKTKPDTKRLGLCRNT